MVAIFSTFSTNIELANTESLSLGETWLSAYEPLVTTFPATDQSITVAGRGTRSRDREWALA